MFRTACCFLTLINSNIEVLSALSRSLFLALLRLDIFCVINKDLDSPLENDIKFVTEVTLLKNKFARGDTFVSKLLTDIHKMVILDLVGLEKFNLSDNRNKKV